MSRASRRVRALLARIQQPVATTMITATMIPARACQLTPATATGIAVRTPAARRASAVAPHLMTRLPATAGPAGGGSPARTGLR